MAGSDQHHVSEHLRKEREKAKPGVVAREFLSKWQRQGMALHERGAGACPEFVIHRGDFIPRTLGLRDLPISLNKFAKESKGAIRINGFLL
jgi:hypothetical protein